MHILPVCRRGVDLGGLVRAAGKMPLVGRRGVRRGAGPSLAFAGGARKFNSRCGEAGWIGVRPNVFAYFEGHAFGILARARSPRATSSG